MKEHEISAAMVEVSTYEIGNLWMRKAKTSSVEPSYFKEKDGRIELIYGH